MNSNDSSELVFLSYAPEYGFGNTCFEVKTEGLNIKGVGNGWEFVCSQNIPPENIELYGYEENE